MSARASLWCAEGLRRVFWLVLVLALVVFGRDGWSDTVPATARWRLPADAPASVANTYCASSAACQSAYVAAEPGCTIQTLSTSPAFPPASPASGSDYQWMWFNGASGCSHSGWHNLRYSPYCPSGTFGGAAGAYTCSGVPACAAGTSRQPDGSCLTVCSVPVNEQVGVGSIYLRPVGGGKVCVNGCSAYIGGRTYTEGGQTYGQAWSYGVQCTGGTEATSTPAGEAPPAEAACHDRGMCSGTVSGATICVTCDSTSSETKTTKTETPPGAAGPTTTTTTTTTTCVEAGSCSTTTTSSTSGPGGSGTSSETTTKPSGAEPDAGEEKPESKPFCEENPESPICKVSSFSGTCGAEPACEGDAVQCAQAREAFKLRCALTPNATDDGPITSAKHSDAAKDALTEQQQQALDLINGVTPDPSSASRSAWDSAMSSGWFEPITITGCSPLHMEFAGHSVTWDHCPVAAKISDIGSYALWFGLLVGGFVFLTGGRNAGVS